MAKKRTQKDSVQVFLNQKVSFFTGSLVLITAFVLAASAIPSYKQENQSSLEVIFSTFIKYADLHQAKIDAEEFRVEIYRKKLQRAENRMLNNEEELIEESNIIENTGEEVAQELDDAPNS